MLNLYTTKRIAEIIGVSEETLIQVAESTSAYVKEKTVYDPHRRPRDIISVSGNWRQIQCRLYERIFKPRLPFSPISHGGVPGRCPSTNATAHRGQSFLYVADIADFFPSVSHDRVFRLFRRLNCSPAVARVLTKLCTYDFHLALGLVTSPILADQILSRVDARLIGLSRRFSEPSLICTRFVDDIAISSQFDLEESSVAKIVRRALQDEGFALKRIDRPFGRIDEGMPITKIRLRRGHADITSEMAVNLENQLHDHKALSDGRPFRGPLRSSSAIEGKVLHAIRINPGRRHRLWRLFRAIRWDSVYWNAKALGLVIAEKTVVLRGSPPPDFSRACSDGTTIPNASIAWGNLGTVSTVSEEPPF